MFDRANMSVEMAKVAEAEFLIDAPHVNAPLAITFGFAAWDDMPRFDFVGRLHKLERASGRPLNMIHIRDTANFWYQHGVPGLGDTVEETAEALGAIIVRLAPTSVITIGQSMGGYGAIMFGALIGADRVLAFGPLSYLRSEWAKRDGDVRWLSVMETLDRFPPPVRHDDLLALLNDSPTRPDVRIIYGDQSAAGDLPNMDRLHAARLASLPNVEALAMPDAPHAVVHWLVANGRIDSLVSTSIFGSDLTVEGQENEALLAPQAKAGPVFDAYWRGWIAENIALGVTPPVLLDTMVTHGFHAADAQRELNKAKRSPYLLPSKEIVHRLNKREWLLGVQRRLGALISGHVPTVDRRHQLSTYEFLTHYYSKNRPVSITGMMDDWPATQWTLAGLADRFAGRSVQVQSGRERNPDYEMEGPSHRAVLPFEDFIGLVGSRAEQNDIYMTANNAAFNKQTLPELWDDLRPLDAYLTSAPQGREGLIWIGPGGTVTPAHHDLTNNMMAQISGTKRVWLVEPSTPAMMQYHTRNIFSLVDLENIDYEKFPAMREATVLQVDLVPGELLFIPIGWWHQVRALDLSFSVTYTNFLFDNGFGASYPHQAV